MEPMTKVAVDDPHYNPRLGPLVRALVDAWKAGRELDPWLTFPQNACTFSFGTDDRPLPIGVLRILWKSGAPFVQQCPD
jgi:hypothetical protein